jgi:hypothetical protein
MAMKISKKILLFLIFFTLLSSSGRLWAVDVLAGLQLAGQLQVFRASDQTTPLKEVALAVQIASKEPRRSNSPRFVTFGSIQLNDLGTGTYLFRINIFHQGNIKIASIETTTAIKGGSKVDFSQSQWRYDYDDDGDGFANLTELVNGHLEAPSGGTVPTIWVGENTDPNNSGSLPSAISLLKPAAISTMAPSTMGRLKVLGDPLAVQSGVYVTAVLRNEAGAQKGKVSGFSRLDGSFDLTLSNAAVGDKVEVFTASLPNLVDDPRFTSFGTSTGPSSRKEMTVQGLALCQ